MKAFFISLFFLLITSVSFSQNSWFRQTSGITSNLKSVYFADENNGWATGDSGKILHTTNGGYNWILQTSNTFRTLDKIIFSDLNNGIAVGNYYEYNPWCFNNSIRLATTNGGLQWNIQFEGYSSNIEEFTKTENNIFLMASEGSNCYGTTGGISKTNNNGINWIPFNTPGTSSYAYKSVFFLNQQSGWALGYKATDYGLWIYHLIKTANGGTGWQYLRRDSGNWIPNPDYFGKKMRFIDSNTGYMFLGSLRKTTNGGTNWNNTDVTATNGKSDYCFINSDTGWCIGGGGSVIRTNNGGTNWTSQKSSVTNSLYSICFVNENVGYITGSNGLILKTITGGLTSIQQTSTVTPSSFFLDQNYPNPFNPKTIINYELGIRNFITLKVFDAQGKEIETLINEEQNAGNYKVEFNGENLPSGIYYYSLYSNGNLIETKKMILLK